MGCGFGLPIPEDLTLFAMGLLSYYGIVDLKISIAVCFAGVMIGDAAVFWIGSHYGKRLLKKGIFAKLFHAERMDATKGLFSKWGNKAIFAARFMPGFRAAMFFSAGTFHVPFKIFFFYDGLAALLSVPLFVGGMYYFGDQVDRFFQIARKFEHGMAFVVVFIAVLLVVKHMVSKRREKLESK